MNNNLSRIGYHGRKAICLHQPGILNEQLVSVVSRIQNALAHPSECRFSYIGSLDDNLMEIQKCLLLIRDGKRANATRALRDELVIEVGAQIEIDKVMHGFLEMPFN